MKRYNPKEIEPKWQKTWAESGIYAATEDPTKPKRYVLEYFPYPSGAAMHVGHVRNYTIGDAVARFYRMRGYNVMHPMGWDAFGLPAENYAIKNNISPQQAIAENTSKFKAQLSQMGFSYDWDREINSSDPKYYRWTQWFFKLLFDRGLAYQKDSLQWWCETDKTVLANEQVEAGKCWRCGNQVVKKPLKQWFFKITDYADRLADDLEDLDWTESIKSMQRNWIGKSKGAEVDFALKDNNPKQNFVILHGFRGRADGGFIPALKNKLEQDGYKVQAPQLPNTDAPTEKEQVEYVINNCLIDENTVLIGHSLGAAVAMKVLEQTKKHIDTLLLVAPVVEPKFRTGKPRNFWDTFDFNYNHTLITELAERRVVLSDHLEDENRKPYIEYLAEKINAEIAETTAQKIHFTADDEPFVYNNLTRSIRVFTTRPDTLFGATFMVLAPEHALVEKITTESQKKAVDAYVKTAQSKSDIERQEQDREKTGVFTGAYAINPVNNESIPIWIADYVLVGYGTGAIMAVPAHDERDNEFAKKFGIPIKQVIAERFIDQTNPFKEAADIVPRSVVTCIVKHPTEDTYLIAKPSNGKNWSPLMGGIDENEAPEEAAKREIMEETGYIDFKSVTQVGDVFASEFYADHKSVNRIAYCHVVYVELGSLSEDKVAAIDIAAQETKWVTETEYKSYPANGGFQEVFEIAHGRYTGMALEGRMINSGKFDGITSSDMRERIVTELEKQGVGKEVVNYKIRDWLISRQRYWGAPIPIIHCPEHGAVAVPDDQLPVVLPEVESYQPTGEGTSVLAGVHDWVDTTCPTCGGPAKRETDTMDGFACSSWYFLRFADPNNDTMPFSAEKAKFWLPVDDYIGGAEHAVMHLLYARMWTKVMFDAGLIEFNEPFKALRNQGMILAPDGRKMSKSWGNVIAPDDIIDQGYGADAIRIMELFIGPWNQAANWSVEGMGGCYRFLQRTWTLTQEFMDSQAMTTMQKASDDQLVRTTHKVIHKVSKDLEDMGFNTAIATLMEFVNELYKYRAEHGFASREEWQFALERLVQLLAPFAPHITEELWQQLGHTESVHISEWPVHEERYLVSDTMTIAVQVNGKLRATLEVGSDSKQDDIVAAAIALENIKAHLNGEPNRVIYVPGKLLNLVG